MRVALIVDSDTKGGAEEYLVRLYEYLAEEKGVTVDLFGSLPNWRDNFLRINVGNGKKLTSSRGKFSQFIDAVRFSRKIRRTVDISKYDIIHIQFMKEKLFLPMKFFKSGKVVWTEHGPLPTNLPSLAYPLLRRKSSFAKIVAVSLSVQTSLAQKGIQSKVIKNPFPERYLTKGLENFNQHNLPIIAYVGRIHPAKRIELLRKAAQLNPQWIFLIAGTGPDFEKLAAQQTSNFRVLGHIENVQDLLESSHVLVITSGSEAREGFPLVALEARSLGTRVAMAVDCHSALEAAEIGVEFFEPNVEALSLILRKMIFKDRKSFLTEDEIESRSLQNWAKSHFELFEELRS